MHLSWTPHSSTRHIARVLVFFALLAGCVFVGRLLTTNPLLGTRLGLGLFLPVWLSTMIFFVWMSMSRDGAAFATLAPMATFVFMVPAIGARFLRWRLGA